MLNMVSTRGRARPSDRRAFHRRWKAPCVPLLTPTAFSLDSAGLANLHDTSGTRDDEISIVVATFDHLALHARRSEELCERHSDVLSSCRRRRNHCTGGSGPLSCKVEHMGAPRLRAVAAGEWAKPVSTKVTWGRVVKFLHGTHNRVNILQESQDATVGIPTGAWFS